MCLIRGQVPRNGKIHSPVVYTFPFQFSCFSMNVEMQSLNSKWQTIPLNRNIQQSTIDVTIRYLILYIVKESVNSYRIEVNIEGKTDTNKNDASQQKQNRQLFLDCVTKYKNVCMNANTKYCRKYREREKKMKKNPFAGNSRII